MRNDGAMDVGIFARVEHILGAEHKSLGFLRMMLDNGVALFVLLGKAFHEMVMTPLQYVITTQLGNVTGLIPLTPGGMGIRDTVTSYFLNTFNASPQEAMALIPVTYSLIMVLWALVGAVFMVTNRAKTN